MHIELPRLEGETPRAFASRLAYVTMGPGRSLEKVAERARTAPEPRPTARLATLKRWSAAHGWGRSAAAYDQALAAAAAAAASEQYRADLELHRIKAKKIGEDLFTVAQALLVQCGRAIRGERIEGKDGKTYIIPAMELTPATLATVARALLAALDLEAHALRIADLLPRLREGGDVQDFDGL